VGTSFLVFAQPEGYSPPLLISTPIDGTSKVFLEYSHVVSPKLRGRALCTSIQGLSMKPSQIYYLKLIPTSGPYPRAEFWDWFIAHLLVSKLNSGIKV
jgi:hypothetical protein